jgi:phosphate starvation-inducible PhoH-like protein
MPEQVINSKEEFYEQVKKEIESKNKVKGLTEGQQDYLDAINENVVTLCSGLAGTGKTYIAVVRAVELLQEGQYKRIVIARPAVECGKSLGFLPGNEDEKVAPYMRPIKDILHELIDAKQLEEYIKNETIEFCALTYMRGRTLNNCIMILDEAQNATWEELMMFLTRIGKNSKIIISGDETQEDVFHKALAQCLCKFDTKPYIREIEVIYLDVEDIVRNGLIRKIIKRMGKYEENYFDHSNK